MERCSKFSIISNFAAEQGVSFPSAQPAICGSCDENICKIADGQIGDHRGYITGDEAGLIAQAERFASLAVSKSTLNKFYARLERTMEMRRTEI